MYFFLFRTMVWRILKKQILLPVMTITFFLVIILTCVILIITLSDSKESNETDDSYHTNGAVAADVGNCSDIGVKILKRNGSAVDSAIATLFCQGVTNVHSSGIGGGLFMVVYVKKLGKAWFYNGREKAPANANRDMFVNNTLAAKQGVETS